MSITLTTVGQRLDFINLFPASSNGKLLLAFDKALAKTLTTNERFTQDNDKHLEIDKAVIEAITDQGLNKKTDSMTSSIIGWLIGIANIEKARRFGYEVANVKEARQRLRDLVVPNFNPQSTTQKAQAPILRLTIGNAVSATSPAGAFRATPAIRQLQLNETQRNAVLQNFGYSPNEIIGEFVDGELVSGAIPTDRQRCDVVLLNTHNSRDNCGSSEVKFRDVRFESYEGFRKTLTVQGATRDLYIHLHERHYALIKKANPPEHSYFMPRQNRRTSLYGFGTGFGFDDFDRFDSPTWNIRTPGAPRPSVTVNPRNPERAMLDDRKHYTVFDRWGNLLTSGDQLIETIYGYSGRTYNFASGKDTKGFTFAIEVRPQNDPLPISSVDINGSSVINSAHKELQNDSPIEIKLRVLTDKVRKLDQDQRYVFLTQGEKPQVGAPITYWTKLHKPKRGGEEQASVVILLDTGRAIQISHKSAALAIPINFGETTMTESKVLDDIDTAARLHNMNPKVDDLKESLGFA